MLILLLVICLVIGVVWQRRNAQKQRRLVVLQLRRWLGTQGSLDPHLQRWVNGLSASEVGVLLDLLNGYCTSLNWELAWLFTPQLQKTPALKQAVEQGVMTYAASILASLQLVEDVSAYKAYASMVQKPTNRKQFTLVQKLYKALSAEGIIVLSTKKRPLFSRQPSRKQKIAAVIDAFERKPTQAMTTLKALLTTEAVLEVQQLTNGAFHPVAVTPVSAAA